MAFTFKCSICNARYFFGEFRLINNEKICLTCIERSKEKEKLELKKKEEERIRKQNESIKQKKKKYNDKLANERLREKLEKSKIKEKEKELKILKKQQKKAAKPKKEEEHHISSNKIIISLENEAKELSNKFESVLYVYADVKRLRVVEWINGKERVALNKERELRRTHKGGFSQEKFQSFVDMKKKQTPKWIEDHIFRQGVLRSQYDKLIIDCHNPDLEKEIIDMLWKRGIR